jgi:hypothetical protein
LGDINVDSAIVYIVGENNFSSANNKTVNEHSAYEIEGVKIEINILFIF